MACSPPYIVIIAPTVQFVYGVSGRIRTLTSSFGDCRAAIDTTDTLLFYMCACWIEWIYHRFDKIHYDHPPIWACWISVISTQSIAHSDFFWPIYEYHRAYYDIAEKFYDVKNPFRGHY